MRCLSALSDVPRIHMTEWLPLRPETIRHLDDLNTDLRSIPFFPVFALHGCMSTHPSFVRPTVTQLSTAEWYHYVNVRSDSELLPAPVTVGCSSMYAGGSWTIIRYERNRGIQLQWLLACLWANMGMWKVWWRYTTSLTMSHLASKVPLGPVL